MTRKEFIEKYMIQFLASWAANVYEDACISDSHERMKHPPVEDAVYLAGLAYDKMIQVLEKY